MAQAVAALTAAIKEGAAAAEAEAEAAAEAEAEAEAGEADAEAEGAAEGAGAVAASHTPAAALRAARVADRLLARVGGGAAPTADVLAACLREMEGVGQTLRAERLRAAFA